MSVSVVRVLVVGGGGGSATDADHTGGGGSGYVNSATLSVIPESTIEIKVGRGGTLGQRGGNSAFGGLLSAEGGHPPSISRNGGNGGSGGGSSCGCNNGQLSGNGGSNGSNGNAGSDNSRPGGIGQLSSLGSFTEKFRIFSRAIFSAGKGGNGNFLYNGGIAYGGGGGGGVLFNWNGPRGEEKYCGNILVEAGQGYGGGGGGGCYQPNQTGGGGAQGLVYVEW